MDFQDLFLMGLMGLPLAGPYREVAEPPMMLLAGQKLFNWQVDH